MKLDLAQFKEGSHRLSLEESAQPFTRIEGASFSQPVRVALSIENSKSHVLISGEAKTTIDLYCDRCLSSTTKPIIGSFKVLYEAREVGEVTDFNDVRPLPRPDAIIELTTDITDSIALNIPMKVLCRESCRGLCAGCGADLNNETCRCQPTVDPRWESLKELLVEDFF